MEWVQLLTILVTIAGLFFWNRSESRTCEEDNKQFRRDLIDVMRSIEQEIKDFHGRLCAIEERNRGK